jgi:hypothetical protein
LSPSPSAVLVRNTCISDEEVDGEEGIDDDTDAAADDTDAAADNAAADDNYATMPPKLKAPPRKPDAKKKIKGESDNDVTAMPPPAPKPRVNFSIDSTDKFLVSYHCKGKQDVADVVFHVSGVLRDTDYRVSVAVDRTSISWQRAIQSICFTKKILQAILKNGYSASSHHAVTYGDIMQEMQEKKVRPKHKLFWGAPQVVHIKWECTVATAIFKRDYEINYVNVDSKGRRNRQCNSVLIVQVKRVKERAETEAEVDAGQISLFGAFSQSSNASEMTTTAAGANSLTRTTTTRRTTTEGGDTVAMEEEGNGRGGTSGCNKFIIT